MPSSSPTPPSYAPGDSTTPTRGRHRARYDAATVHAVLDEALVCHVGYVVAGRPVVVPTIHARVGQVLYLHGSVAATVAARAAEAVDGVDVCVTVTLVDGLVLARSAFHHSMNYRSVVVRGRAALVTDAAERARALDAVVDHVLAGRSADSRPGNRRELAATAVLALPLREVSAKVRTGDPVDDDEDLPGPWWAGTVPVRTCLGDPVPAADLAPGTRLPAYLQPPTRPQAAGSAALI